MSEERPAATIEDLNPVGLVVAAIGVAGSCVATYLFAVRAKTAVVPQWWHLWAMWGAVVVGLVLVEAGSWLSAGFYRAFERAERRPWFELAGALALVPGLILLGNGLWLHGSSEAVGRWPAVLMVLGLLLIELALLALHRGMIRICTSPSFPLTLIVVAAGLLGVMAFALLSVISVRHYARADLTEIGLDRLSPRTVSILRKLDEPIQIVSTMVHNPNPHMPREQFNNVVRRRVNSMLDEYAHNSRYVDHIKVNPYADPDVLAKLESQLKVNVGADTVIFARGEETKVIEFDELIEQSFMSEEMPKFKGEGAFSGALQALIEGTKTKVYFVTGHGEKRIDNYDDRDGLSRLANLVKSDNCEVKTIELTEPVPDDCDVLVIAGPERAFDPAELDAVRDYIGGTEKGRGLIVMVDPVPGDGVKSGLEDILKDHGIVAETDQTVVEASTLELIPGLVGRGPASIKIAASDYPMGMVGMSPMAHPITSEIKGIRTIFYGACPVSARSAPMAYPGGPRGDPHTVELVKTSDRSFAKTGLDRRGRAVGPSEGEDKGGPFCLAVARGKWTEIPPPMRMRMPVPPPPRGRIVVFGDSDFVVNRLLRTGRAGNSTLFRSALAWAAAKEYKIGIPPRPLVQVQRIDPDAAQRHFAHWATVFAPPFHVLLIGIIVWWVRRR